MTSSSALPARPSALRAAPRGRAKAAIREESEQQILKAAESVFAEQGFKGATTAVIAARAGVPKANLHYYFPTKDDLYRRVIEDVCDSWLSRTGAFSAADDPAVALTRYIYAKMDLSRSRPDGSRVWANEMIRGARVTSDYISDTVRRWLRDREAAIRQWIDSGQIAPVDPRTLMFMIWASTQHFADFASQIRLLNDGTDYTDTAFTRQKRHVAEILLRGVGLSVPDSVDATTGASSVFLP